MTMRSALSVRRCERGIATVEFALLAPVMLGMICGIFEFGYVAAARSSLESATLRAARSAAASECPAERFVKLDAMIKRQMSGISSVNNLPPTITIKSYGSDFGNAGQPEPFDDTNRNGRYDAGESHTEVNGQAGWQSDMGKNGNLGAVGEVVTYEATFTVRSLVPMIAEQFNNGSGGYPIKARTAVRNEPVFRNRCT